jgi:hypothetical protein
MGAVGEWIDMRKIKRRDKWEYTYDLDDEKFMKYYHSTTGILVGLELKRKLSYFLLTDPTADDWLRTSPLFKYVKSKEMIPFGVEREAFVSWHKILRDSLQRHWIKYTTKPKRKIKRRR